MRNFLLAFGSLVALTATASAQPVVTAATAEPQPTPASYVEVGATAGAFAGIYVGATLEGGRRIGSGPLWIHAMVVDGAAGGIDEPGAPGKELQVRAGVETRACLATALCGFAGVDAGYAHGEYMAEYDHADKTDGLAIARVGLDVGSRRLRLRPGLELGFGYSGFEQIALTGGVAYQF